MTEQDAADSLTADRDEIRINWPRPRAFDFPYTPPIISNIPALRGLPLKYAAQMYVESTYYPAQPR